MPQSVLTQKRSLIAWFAVLAMIASLIAIAQPARAHSVAIDTTATCPSTIPNAGFNDISAFDAETQQAINCIAFYGVSIGTSATTYSPSLVTFRRHMALFLTRTATVMGITLPAPSNQGFTDISTLPQEEQNAINQLGQLGITKGTSATTFSPNEDVDRWEMALFLQRLLNVAGFTFPDDVTHGNFLDTATLSAEAQAAIDDLADAHIALGVGGNLYAPLNAVSRWQMALFLTRVMAADGVTPTDVADTFLDGIPELVSVAEESFSSSSEELVLVYTFDEEIDFVSDEDQFHVYEGNGDQEEADDSTVDGNEVTVTFEDIDQDIYDELTTAAVGQSAVEDEDGDVNPEKSVPFKDATITSDAGELDNDENLVNLVDVTWESRDLGADTSDFTFEFDDDVTVAAAEGGFSIVLTDGVEANNLTCTADGAQTDDEIDVVCDNAIDDDDWARGLVEDTILDQNAVQIVDATLFQVVDEAASSHPDLTTVRILSDDRAEFVFDEQVSLFTGGGVANADEDTDATYAGALTDFNIYNQDGELALAPTDAIVTGSNRVVRVQFPDDPWGADTELDDEAEGGFVLADAVEERSGDEDGNARDEARVGAAADVEIDAGDVTDPQLESVSDITVSSTDLEGDADEWEVVFTFDEDLVEGDDVGGECDPALFRVYLEDGTIVEGDECETDNDDATVTFVDDDIEDGLLAGVAWGAVFADDNDDENIEDALPTEFAG